MQYIIYNLQYDLLQLLILLLLLLLHFCPAALSQSFVVTLSFLVVQLIFLFMPIYTFFHFYTLMGVYFLNILQGVPPVCIQCCVCASEPPKGINKVTYLPTDHIVHSSFYTHPPKFHLDCYVATNAFIWLHTAGWRALPTAFSCSLSVCGALKNKQTKSLSIHKK